MNKAVYVILINENVTLINRKCDSYKLHNSSTGILINFIPHSVILITLIIVTLHNYKSLEFLNPFYKHKFLCKVQV